MNEPQTKIEKRTIGKKFLIKGFILILTSVLVPVTRGQQTFDPSLR